MTQTKKALNSKSLNDMCSNELKTISRHRPFNPKKYGIFSSFQHMARGLIGHPLIDDIGMVRDNFGGLGAPMPYVMGWYWGSAVPLSNTISPWIFRVQKNESV